jgi:RNA polymerase sigma factor (sigma-70 family)
MGSKRTARAGLSANDLVMRAKEGDKQAWDVIVERYAPLVWSICRSHPLADADADAVNRSVWLQLVGQLPTLDDPAALLGWMVTTTQRECSSIRPAAPGLRAARYVLNAEHIPDGQTGTAGQKLVVAERHAALREAFTRLSPCCQQLIAMLIEDSTASSAEISAKLGIPVGIIARRRGRCLDKLRRDPAIAALINPEAAGRQLPEQATVPGRRSATVIGRRLW